MIPAENQLNFLLKLPADDARRHQALLTDKEVIEATRVIDCPECGEALCDYHYPLSCYDCGGVAGMVPGCTCP